ncbi:hypothetical protein BGZ60DRAFT_526948 [Tricladium varicosporioides]|nr:hypothetical protein BGZ60DRAFT_526948 [Hymenoscyphus varicosporioides]
MKLLDFLLSLSCIFMLQGIALAQNSADAFWFLPGVPITKFSTTMVVPSVSPGSGYHAVWPGLENSGGSFVYQSVVSDSKGVGSWKFWVEYCCNPDYKATAVNVYPGDAITSVFSLGSDGFWTDAWSIVRGPAGVAAGASSTSGSSSNAFPNAGDLTRAVLAIETAKAGTWDFGQVSFTNIAVSASTTNGWCSTGYAVTPTFSYSVSGGTQQTVGGTTTCTYNQVLLKGP